MPSLRASSSIRSLSPLQIVVLPAPLKPTPSLHLFRKVRPWAEGGGGGDAFIREQRKKNNNDDDNDGTTSYAESIYLLRNVGAADRALLELGRTREAAAVVTARDQRAVHLSFKAHLMK